MKRLAVPICAAALAVNGQQSVWHVDPDATISGDGSTWALAYSNLTDALAAVNASTASNKEIRLADGVYKPRLDLDAGTRSNGFTISSSMRVVGGYAGKSDPDAYDPEVYETHLVGHPGPNEFAYQIVFVTGGSPSDQVDVEFDHVTIRDGYTATTANADPFVDKRGAGMFASHAHLTLSNCVFTQHDGRAPGPNVRGTALSALDSGSVTMTDCLFTENDGGRSVIYIVDGLDVVAHRCTFSHNTLEQMGAFECSASTIDIDDCYFGFNSSEGSGPAGLEIVGGSVVTISNSVFEYNHGQTWGGAMGLKGVGPDSTVTDCVFYRNSSDAVDNCPGLDPCERYVGPGAAEFQFITVTGCLFEDNTGGIGTGGAVLARGSTFVNCSFIGNKAIGEGGANGYGPGHAIANPLGDANTLVNCVFVANGRAAIKTPAFDPFVNTPPGSNSNTGGAYFGRLDTAVNCVFAGNLAAEGGAMHLVGMAETDIINCLIWSNDSTNGIPGIFIDSPLDVDVYNSHMELNWEIWEENGSTTRELFPNQSPDHSALDIFHMGGRDTGGNSVVPPFIVDGSPFAYPPHMTGIPVSTVPFLSFVRQAIGSGFVDAGRGDIVPLDTYDVDRDGDTTEITPALDWDLDIYAPHTWRGAPRQIDIALAADYPHGTMECNVDLGPWEVRCDPCPADVNRNGSVDPNDLTAWVLAFDTWNDDTNSNNDIKADQNCDFMVTLDDFNAFLLNFNQSSGMPCVDIVPPCN
ncbi:MAG: right-handed parallel beta-helix repeat-containing protein [Planctomycetota bacterium]